MIPELDAIFEKYEALVKQMDSVFDSVQKQYSDCVKCHEGCADCCHALFDLSLVEAMYINRQFLEKIDEAKRLQILEVANQTDRKLYQLKRKAYQAVTSGEKSEELVLLEMAAERMRCPLLNDGDRCELYRKRPITCRLYGIPTAIGGRGHTCGMSGFVAGESYPTVNMDAIQQQLHLLSQEIVATLRSRQVMMGDVLMPLSMALLTVFDENYLGVGEEKKETEKDDGPV